jgi:hypothetical protein
MRLCSKICEENLIWNLYTRSFTRSSSVNTVYFYIYNISIYKVGKSKHNKIVLRYKESEERQHVSALLL